MSYIINLPTCGSNRMSSIKSMSFLLLFTGIILITIGYIKSENIKPLYISQESIKIRNT